MKIVVLCGGISTERYVSLVSGTKIYEALKERGHKVILLDVFFGCDETPEGIFDLEVDWEKRVNSVTEVGMPLNEVKALREDKSDNIFGKNVIDICRMADIVFLGLHGDFGENGKLQGAFELMGIKYTGTDALSSALAMDKSITKQLFIYNHINTPKSFMLSSVDDKTEPMLPCVVKVCNGGSSVGVYIAKTKEEYKEAVKNAFEYESEVLVEEYIKGRELTCAVIEGEALPIVEIEPKTGFYDYINKYKAGATVETCPAKVSDEITKKVQDMAVAAYNALHMKAYARMDFIYGEDGDVYCLEANTLPGMTPTSLIPQEAAAIGKTFPELCEWIIEVSLRK